MLNIAIVIKNNLFIFLFLSLLYSGPSWLSFLLSFLLFYLFTFYLFRPLLFTCLWLFVILCRNPLFGFDGAKLRRFWVLAKYSHGIVCANSRFFDEGQQIAVYSFFLQFFCKCHASHSISQPPVSLGNACVQRGFRTGGQTYKPPVNLPSSLPFSLPLFQREVYGRSVGGQTGGVTGGLRNVKSFVHRHFGHPTGGVAIFMQNMYKNPLHHPLYGLPGRNGTLGRTKPMT